MNRAKWHAVAAALAAWGCAETTPSGEPVAPIPAIEPVTPREVTGPVEEIARLRARVSELERQLERCASASDEGETAALPDGVEPPAPAPTPEPSRTERTVRRDPPRLDEVLPRRRGDTIEIPDPTRLLLGGE